MGDRRHLWALHFALIHDLITATYPGWRHGFLPALFILPFAFGVSI